MPKSFPILQAHWPEFLFDCSNCHNEEHCLEQGICQHEVPSDGDHDVDDSLRREIAKGIREANDDQREYRMAVCGDSYPNYGNFQYQYND